MMSNTSTINKEDIKRFIFVFLITLTIVQQLPVIREVFYEIFRLLLYLSFSILTTLSVGKIKKYLRYRLVKYFFIVLVYVLFFNIFVFASVQNLDLLFHFLVPFGIVLCSLNTDFEKQQLNKLLFWYAFIVSILGISTVLYYGPGFTISEFYNIPSKNQVGPIIGHAILIITFFLLLNKDQMNLKYNYLLIKIGIFGSLFLSLLVIRNRAGLIGLLMVILLIIFTSFRPRLTLKNIVSIQVVLILCFLFFINGYFNSVVDLFWDSLTLNFDMSDLDSISAGRTETYKDALEFIFMHPIGGVLESSAFFNRTPHNYILFNWSRYGSVMSLPFVLFYLYLYYFVIKELLRMKLDNISTSHLTLWVLLFSLIVSNFEYLYPFGPGVSQIILWFLLGQYLKNRYENNF